ncbi:hypothetical protein FRC09_013158 [Ceratobasidium sp. 395]|nr:hypothetical protein FRC09_013158 [Ceratobasidium sp. 395]
MPSLSPPRVRAITNVAYSAHTNDRGMHTIDRVSSSDLPVPPKVCQTAAVGESGTKAATDPQMGYDSPVAALKRFRNGHIKTVYREHVQQSIEAGRKGGMTTDGITEMGGTSLVPLLKERRSKTAGDVVSSSPVSGE